MERELLTRGLGFSRVYQMNVNSLSVTSLEIMVVWSRQTNTKFQSVLWCLEGVQQPHSTA